MMRLEQLTVRLLPDTANWITKKAKARGIPTAQVIREIVENSQAREQIPALTAAELIAEVEARAEKEARRQSGINPVTLGGELAALREERERLMVKAQDAVTPEIAEALQDKIQDLNGQIAEIEEQMRAYEDQQKKLKARIAAQEIERIAPLLENITDEMGQMLGVVSALAVLLGDPAIPRIVVTSLLERLRQRVPDVNIGGNIFRTGNVLADLCQASPHFVRARG